MFTYPIDLFGKLFTFPITAKKYTKVQLENEEETTSIFNIVQFGRFSERKMLK